MAHINHNSTRVFFVFSMLFGLSACGGGGGYGGGGGGGGGGSSTVLFETEGNNTVALADVIALGRPAAGSLDSTGDVDYWTVQLNAGQTIQVELFATRLDQVRWDTVTNVPRMTLYAIDGTTKVLEHDYGGFTSNGWAWGKHDLDFPLFRVPASGMYYLSLRQDVVGIQGGDYTFLIKTRTLSNYQTESEAVGATGANDTAGSAQTITPGNLQGFHVDGEDDFFSFAVAGPSVVRLELTSYRNGVFAGDDQYFDGRMRLYDSDGTTELDSSDDSYFSDPALHHRIDTAGTYFVDVSEASGAGDAAYFLSFAVESVAAPTAEIETNDTSATANAIAYGARAQGTTDSGDPDYFVFSATAGDLVRVQYFDADDWREAADDVDVDVYASDGSTSIPSDPDGSLQVESFLVKQTGSVYLRVAGNAASTSYSFQLERFCSAAWEMEFNDNTASANALDANGRGAGVLSNNNDEDFWSFYAQKDRPVTLQIYATFSLHSDGYMEYSGHGSSLPPFLRVRNTTGGQITIGHYGRVVGTEGVVTGLPTAAATIIPTTNGTYFVEVDSVNNLGAADYHYVIEKR